MEPDTRANALLRLCLGIDESGGYQPAGFEGRLAAAAASAAAGDRAFLERVLAEDRAPDWARHSLAEESALFARHLAVVFPALEPRIVQALVNRWAYGWR